MSKSTFSRGRYILNRSKRKSMFQTDEIKHSKKGQRVYFPEVDTF